ncbi:MAG: MOSC domain-containing protein [Cyanobacteria bacterium P01_D01_bin.1]
MDIGYIKSLWRYPVKSLGGEAVETLEFDERGAISDRMFAMLTGDGKLGSGKNTRRFSQIDGLLSLSAAITSEGVKISFPYGETLTARDSSLNTRLSEYLGQSVRMVRENQISHLDDGAVHLITSRVLTSLKDELPDVDIDERRFRPNIVIETTCSDDDLVGNELLIGDIALHVTHKTERCRMIMLEQSGIENQPKLLKTVSKKYDLQFGVYASVSSPGTISVGNKVELFSKTI